MAQAFILTRHERNILAAKVKVLGPKGKSINGP
jgi:hypothetical protein